MNTAPIFSAATAISFETAGSMVEESINSVPFFTFLIELRKKKKRGGGFLFSHRASLFPHEHGAVKVYQKESVKGKLAYLRMPFGPV